eukprot:CAMPEP_0194340128 /NCGR_PEP_ID=MMETSP0171-20130528/85290_1 /TAXON_ID=218684 /ORGANISM="Corethron pennatum, Strain L29A3" /LENGTH=828 /DNA_ID=CAMNT_0039104953 /DNA_START=103 /DNA_END=2589 /DNA_ORIENTATION=+
MRYPISNRDDTDVMRSILHRSPGRGGSFNPGRNIREYYSRSPSPTFSTDDISKPDLDLIGHTNASIKRTNYLRSLSRDASPARLVSPDGVGVQAILPLGSLLEHRTSAVQQYHEVKHDQWLKSYREKVDIEHRQQKEKHDVWLKNYKTKLNTNADTALSATFSDTDMKITPAKIMKKLNQQPLNDPSSSFASGNHSTDQILRGKVEQNRKLKAHHGTKKDDGDCLFDDLTEVSSTTTAPSLSLPFASERLSISTHTVINSSEKVLSPGKGLEHDHQENRNDSLVALSSASPGADNRNLTVCHPLSPVKLEQRRSYTKKLNDICRDINKTKISEQQNLLEEQSKKNHDFFVRSKSFDRRDESTTKRASESSRDLTPKNDSNEQNKEQKHPSDLVLEKKNCGDTSKSHVPVRQAGCRQLNNKKLSETNRNQGQGKVEKHLHRHDSAATLSPPALRRSRSNTSTVTSFSRGKRHQSYNRKLSENCRDTTPTSIIKRPNELHPLSPRTTSAASKIISGSQQKKKNDLMVVKLSRTYSLGSRVISGSQRVPVSSPRTVSLGSRAFNGSQQKNHNDLLQVSSFSVGSRTSNGSKLKKQVRDVSSISSKAQNLGTRVMNGTKEKGAKWIRKYKKKSHPLTTIKEQHREQKNEEGRGGESQKVLVDTKNDSNKPEIKTSTSDIHCAVDDTTVDEIESFQIEIPLCTNPHQQNSSTNNCNSSLSIDEKNSKESMVVKKVTDVQDGLVNESIEISTSFITTLDDEVRSIPTRNMHNEKVSTEYNKPLQDINEEELYPSSLKEYNNYTSDNSSTSTMSSLSEPIFRANNCMGCSTMLFQ